MKTKRRRALKDKRARIAAGTNNGWMNFIIETMCRDCMGTSADYGCKLREDFVGTGSEDKCAKKIYEAMNQ